MAWREGLPGLSLSMTTWGGSRNWQHTQVNFRRFDQQNVENYMTISLDSSSSSFSEPPHVHVKNTASLRSAVRLLDTDYHWISIISTMEENGEPLKPKIVISYSLKNGGICWSRWLIVISNMALNGNKMSFKPIGCNRLSKFFFRETHAAYPLGMLEIFTHLRWPNEHFMVTSWYSDPSGRGPAGSPAFWDSRIASNGIPNSSSRYQMMFNGI